MWELSMFADTKMVESLLECYDSNYEELYNRIMVCNSIEVLKKIIEVIESSKVDYGQGDDLKQYCSNPLFIIRKIFWILLLDKENKDTSKYYSECLVYWNHTSRGRVEYSALKVGDVVSIERMFEFNEKLKNLVSNRLAEVVLENNLSCEYILERRKFTFFKKFKSWESNKNKINLLRGVGCIVAYTLVTSIFVSIYTQGKLETLEERRSDAYKQILLYEALFLLKKNLFYEVLFLFN